MKKSILSLEGVEVLSKKQMKTVGGGACAALITNGDGEILVLWGTKDEVLDTKPNRWCCASCSTASWIGSCNIC
jgi:hypothetical protein